MLQREEEREVVLEGCDPEALNIVLEYMYGIDLPSMVLTHNFVQHFYIYPRTVPNSAISWKLLRCS